MNIAEVCFVRQNALLMVFQRIYCRVNTVWPPLVFGLLHPHYHTSDRIIGGVHMFIQVSSGRTRVPTKINMLERAIEQGSLVVSS